MSDMSAGHTPTVVEHNGLWTGGGQGLWLSVDYREGGGLLMEQLVSVDLLKIVKYPRYEVQPHSALMVIYFPFVLCGALVVFLANKMKRSLSLGLYRAVKFK